jgi:hypothetical protein
MLKCIPKEFYISGPQLTDTKLLTIPTPPNFPSNMLGVLANLNNDKDTVLSPFKNVDYVAWGAVIQTAPLNSLKACITQLNDVIIKYNKYATTLSKIDCTNLKKSVMLAKSYLDASAQSDKYPIKMQPPPLIQQQGFSMMKSMERLTDVSVLCL